MAGSCHCMTWCCNVTPQLIATQHWTLLLYLAANQSRCHSTLSSTELYIWQLVSQGKEPHHGSADHDEQPVLLQPGLLGLGHLLAVLANNTFRTCGLSADTTRPLRIFSQELRFWHGLGWVCCMHQPSTISQLVWVRIRKPAGIPPPDKFSEFKSFF